MAGPEPEAVEAPGDVAWGSEPEHAVQAVRFLIKRHGFAPNYNMLVSCITYPWGTLAGCSVVDAAVRAGLLVEVNRAFGGCRTAFELPTEEATRAR